MAYGSGATSEYRFEVTVFEGGGAIWPKCQVEGDIPYQSFFVSQNKMHRPYVRYNYLGRSLFRFVTIHVFDGQMDTSDGQTYGWHYDNQYHACIDPDK